MNDRNPTWRDLYLFIQEQITKEGEEFLDNEFFVECQNEETINQSFNTIRDSEDWLYTQPAWWYNKDTGRFDVLTSRWKDKKIVTLNINY